VALDDLERIVAPLGIAAGARGGVNARLAARGLWHLTLAFLGEVPENKVGAVGRALDRAAEQAAPSHLRLAGGGRFGKRRFSTVYVAVAGDVAGLERVAAAVRHELTAIRISHDRKRFVPHLTLARPGDRLPETQLLDDLAVLEAYRGPLWTNTEISLVASHLGPQPRHEIVHVATLAG
jgi:2'-5' RNA ligase